MSHPAPHPAPVPQPPLPGTPAPAYGTPPPAPGTPTVEPPAYGPPAYGPPAYGPPAPRTHPLALAALVTGLLGFALIPVVLGHLALSQIRRTGDGGAWMAVVGLVLGYGTCALYVVLFLVFGGFLWWGVQA